MSVHQQTLNDNGLQWTYLVGGSGPRVILWLHGLMGNGTDCLPLAEALADRARFICPTLPATRDLSRIVQGLRLILRTEQTQTVVVAGGSFGGLIAQAFAALCPQNVETAILFDTLGPSEKHAAANEKAAVVLRWAPTWLLRLLFRLKLSKLSRVDAELTPQQTQLMVEARERLRRRVAALDKAGLLAQMYLAAQCLRLDPVAGLQQPGALLVLRGMDDPGTRNGDGLDVYATAEVVELDGVGHLGSLLQRDRYIAEFRAFMDRRDSTAGPRAGIDPITG